MATTPTTVRVSEEKLEQFKEIQGAFERGSDFADWVIQAYKLHKSVKTTDLFTADLQALEGMLKSITGTIDGVISRAEGIILSKDAEVAEDLRARDQIVEDLKDEMELLRQELKSKDEIIKTQKETISDIQKELMNTQEEMKKVQKDYNTTCNLNDILMSEKARYEGIEGENKELSITVAKLTEKLTEAEKQVNADTQKITELEKENASLIEKHSEKIATIEKNHKDALNLAELVKEAEVSKAKSDIKELVQAKIDKYIEKEQDLRNEIDTLRKELNILIRENEKTVSELKQEHEEQINKTIEGHSKETEKLKKQLDTLKKKDKVSHSQSNTIETKK